MKDFKQNCACVVFDSGGFMFFCMKKSGVGGELVCVLFFSVDGLHGVRPTSVHPRLFGGPSLVNAFCGF